MKHKLILIAVFGAMLSSATFAQDDLSVQTNLKNVTVFTNGAELNHEANINLPTGNSEIIFTHVASNIDENSIQVSADPTVTILSVRSSKNNNTPTANSEEYVKTEIALKSEKNKLTELKNALETEESVLQLLEKNQQIKTTNTGSSVAELIKMTEYYQPKYLQVKNKISKLQDQITLQSPVVERIQAKLDELQGQTSAAGGQLLIQVMNASAGLKPFMISYLSSQAGWHASYDVRANDLASPIKIIYKANVFQNTGVDWSKVQLRLSSGNPTQSGTAPILQPWHLRFDQPLVNYDLRPQSAQLQNEVLVSNTKGTSNLAKQKSPFVVQTENQLHTTFDIDIPYTIISNGKIHGVNLREYNTPATYKYTVSPRINSDVYLIAELTQYENINLVPGEANVFVENTIVGKTYLNPNNTSDSMIVSLGRDKLIQAKRELVSELSQTKTFGNSKTAKYTYEISLKNNKKSPVVLTVNDQYPLSTDDDIQIELLEKDGANVNPETGIVTWNISMAPGESKKIKLSYSIKYPKNKNIRH